MKKQLKILILADPASSHTSKWVNSLSKKGIILKLFGLSSFIPEQYDSNIEVISYQIPSAAKSKSDGDLSKIIYLKSLYKLRKIIKSFNPSVIHAHYASSYGLLAALSGFNPIITSIWGNDVFDFPKISWLHKKTFQFVIQKSYRIYSTSKIMAVEINKYTNKSVKVIPFGIDTEIFKPIVQKKIFDPDTIVLGSIKSLSYKYGNDTVIKAFKIIKDKLPQVKLKLILIGDGILKNQLEKLVSDLNLIDDVIFLGYIPHSQIHKYHNMIDIHIYPSIWESFGVANLEAAACEKVQIASNIDAFKEILNDNIDCFLVDPNEPEQIADKLYLLITNENLRIKMGKEARKNVIRNFNWADNLSTMIEEYNSFGENKY